MALELSSLERRGALILEPVGKLDAKGARELEEHVDGLMGSGELHLVVDLARADEIGGAALRSLLMLVKRLSGHGGSLVLCGLVADAREAFEVAGLSGVFVIAGSRDEALALSRAHRVRSGEVGEMVAELLERDRTGEIDLASVMDPGRDAEVRRVADLAAALMGITRDEDSQAADEVPGLPPDPE